jgi:Uma2 family endonuclease
MSASRALPLTVSVEEYLGNPAEYEHCEWVDGRVEPLNVGSRTHSRLQVRLGRRFDEYFDDHPGGFVGAELHCRLTIGGRSRYRLPDLAIVLGDEGPDETYLHRAPDLAIEIRSTEDSITWLLKKAGEYFANGSKLVWLVIPEEESVWVLTMGGTLEAFVKGETLGGGDVLPGFELAVDDLFPGPETNDPKL